MSNNELERKEETAITLQIKKERHLISFVNENKFLIIFFDYISKPLFRGILMKKENYNE